MWTEEILHSHVDGGEGLLAIVFHGNGDYKPGIHFHTAGDAPLQVATMRRPVGSVVAPHRHREVRRTVSVQTQELLIVRAGRVRIDFFTSAGAEMGQSTLGPGDMVLLLRGGHGLQILEEAEIVEVKQGPYAGTDDKVYFDGTIPAA